MADDYVLERSLVNISQHVYIANKFAGAIYFFDVPSVEAWLDTIGREQC